MCPEHLANLATLVAGTAAGGSQQLQLARAVLSARLCIPIKTRGNVQ